MPKFVALLLWLLLQSGLRAQTAVPPPQRWVTDGPHVLSLETRVALDRRLAAYEKTTGHQVLVWIGESTGGVPIEDWAVRTFAAWKVGRKGLDDGLVLFLMTQDHKLRLEVGYGLEGQMPDLIASRILSEAIVPKLQSGDWDGAATAGVDRILGTLGGETRAPGGQDASSHPRSPPMGLGTKILLGFMALGLLVLIVTNPSLAIGLLFSLMSGGRGGGGSGGGGWSGGGGRSGGGGASGSW